MYREKLQRSSISSLPNTQAAGAVLTMAADMSAASKDVVRTALSCIFFSGSNTAMLRLDGEIIKRNFREKLRRMLYSF